MNEDKNALKCLTVENLFNSLSKMSRNLETI